MNKLALLWLLTALITTRLIGASITHTLTVFPQMTDWRVTNSIPQFDPGLGSLTNVSVSVSVNAANRLRTENRDRQSWETTASGEVQAIADVGGHVTSTSVTNTYSTTLTAFDGLLDYQGTSGFDVTVVGGSSSIGQPASVVGFSGTNSIPIIIGATAIGRYDGSGYSRFIINTTASALVTVTYEFSPPTCPPAPEDCDDRRKPDSDDCDDRDGRDDRRKSRNRRR